ncbi:hypothetical protein Vretimale_2833 [Volvox reticuliferus]|uniref:Uncharacterized protein n=1 Tax=Volvox reticuliferus TaxID=1737510 RepID=A0A8J4D891_9CHLO|nr:hypothetical protein Vretimale_2833 [Volvox reticuliferus]
MKNHLEASATHAKGLKTQLSTEEDPTVGSHAHVGRVRARVRSSYMCGALEVDGGAEETGGAPVPVEAHWRPLPHRLHGVDHCRDADSADQLAAVQAYPSASAPELLQLHQGPAAPGIQSPDSVHIDHNLDWEAWSSVRLDDPHLRLPVCILEKGGRLVQQQQHLCGSHTPLQQDAGSELDAAREAICRLTAKLTATQEVTDELQQRLRKSEATLAGTEALCALTEATLDEVLRQAEQAAKAAAVEAEARVQIQAALVAQVQAKVAEVQEAARRDLASAEQRLAHELQQHLRQWEEALAAAEALHVEKQSALKESVRLTAQAVEAAMARVEAQAVMAAREHAEMAGVQEAAWRNLEAKIKALQADLAAMRAEAASTKVASREGLAAVEARLMVAETEATQERLLAEASRLHRFEEAAPTTVEEELNSVMSELVEAQLATAAEAQRASACEAAEARLRSQNDELQKRLLEAGVEVSELEVMVRDLEKRLAATTERADGLAAQLRAKEAAQAAEVAKIRVEAQAALTAQAQAHATEAQEAARDLASIEHRLANELHQQLRQWEEALAVAEASHVEKQSVLNESVRLSAQAAEAAMDLVAVQTAMAAQAHAQLAEVQEAARCGLGAAWAELASAEAVLRERSAAAETRLLEAEMEAEAARKHHQTEASLLRDSLTSAEQRVRDLEEQLTATRLAAEQGAVAAANAKAETERQMRAMNITLSLEKQLANTDAAIMEQKLREELDAARHEIVIHINNTALMSDELRQMRAKIEPLESQLAASATALAKFQGRLRCAEQREELERRARHETAMDLMATRDGLIRDVMWLRESLAREQQRTGELRRELQEVRGLV